MNRKEGLEIAQIGKSFSVLGPTEVSVKQRGFTRWCTLPYSRYPDGCSNFGNRADCPPDAGYFRDNLGSRVLVAALDFSFREYLEKRHWQGYLRAELRSNIEAALEDPVLGRYVAVYNPEAQGVNVHQTCAGVGLHLEWPPQCHMLRIALLAIPNK